MKEPFPGYIGETGRKVTDEMRIGSRLIRVTGNLWLDSVCGWPQHRAMTQPDAARYSDPDACRAGTGIFPATRWSLILDFQTGSDAQKRAVVESFYRIYHRPVYAWLRNRGSSHEDAEDLAQDLFAEILEKGLLGKVSPKEGTLRSYLKRLLQNKSVDEWRKANSKKRGGEFKFVPIDGDIPLQDLRWEGLSPDVAFDRAWATAVVGTVRQQLRQECGDTEKAALFDGLWKYLGGGATKETLPVIAGRLGLTPATVKQANYRLKMAFRNALMDELLKTASTPAEAEAEMKHLFSVFQQ